MPVTIRDVDEATIEILRMEENIRRRVLKPSEMARVARRLFAISKLKNGGDRRSENFSSPRSNIKTIADEVGLAPRTVERYNKIANLIPELMALLDARQITDRVGEVLC